MAKLPKNLLQLGEKNEDGPSLKQIFNADGTGQWMNIAKKTMVNEFKAFKAGIVDYYQAVMHQVTLQ